MLQAAFKLIICISPIVSVKIYYFLYKLSQ